MPCFFQRRRFGVVREGADETRAFQGRVGGWGGYALGRPRTYVRGYARSSRWDWVVRSSAFAVLSVRSLTVAAPIFTPGPSPREGEERREARQWDGCGNGRHPQGVTLQAPLPDGRGSDCDRGGRGFEIGDSRGRRATGGAGAQQLSTGTRKYEGFRGWRVRELKR